MNLVGFMAEFAKALERNCSIKKLTLAQMELSSVISIIRRNNSLCFVCLFTENMMILQRRKDGNIVSKLPRRLLIHLFSFLGQGQSRQEPPLLLNTAQKRNASKREANEECKYSHRTIDLFLEREMKKEDGESI